MFAKYIFSNLFFEKQTFLEKKRKNRLILGRYHQMMTSTRKIYAFELHVQNVTSVKF